VDQRPGYKRDAIKAMLRFHLIPVRMLIFKNRNNICWQGWVEIGTLGKILQRQILILAE
jgi:hypothetical protein